MDEDELKVGNFFTKEGDDIWELKSYCLNPTCTLINLQTDKEETFGIGGLISESFIKINMPKKAKKELKKKIENMLK